MIKRCCTYVSYTQQREITRLDAVKPTPHIRVEESMAYNAVLTPNNNLVAPRVGMITYIYTASKDWCRVIVHCGDYMALIPRVLSTKYSSSGKSSRSVQTALYYYRDRQDRLFTLPERRYLYLFECLKAATRGTFCVNKNTSIAGSCPVVNYRPSLPASRAELKTDTPVAIVAKIR